MQLNIKTTLKIFCLPIVTWASKLTSGHAVLSLSIAMMGIFSKKFPSTAQTEKSNLVEDWVLFLLFKKLYMTCVPGFYRIWEQLEILGVNKMPCSVLANSSFMITSAPEQTPGSCSSKQSTLLFLLGCNDPVPTDFSLKKSL